MARARETAWRLEVMAVLFQKAKSQLSHGSSQWSVSPVPEDLMPYSRLCGYQNHIGINAGTNPYT